MTEYSVNKEKSSIYLIEAMIVLAVLSSLLLPCFFFLSEYIKGGTKVKDNLEILASLEEKLNIILAMPFKDIPEGKSENIIIEAKNGSKLDLKSITLSNKKVDFECFVEVFPTNFSAVKNVSSHLVNRVSVKNALKRITLSAKWGNGENIQLESFKANIE